MLAVAAHVAPKVDSTDTRLLFALLLRRLGQLWRRAERAAPDAWVSFADRVGPELLSEAVRGSEVGRVATGLAGAASENRNVSGLQAVTIWADALAAGYGYAPGEALLELESERGLSEALPAAAVPAELGAALLHADAPPLYWPLVPQPERPEPVTHEALPRPAGEADFGSLYAALFKQAKERLAALTAETPEALLAGIFELLELVRHVPVQLANSRLVGMREQVLTAATVAAALRRAVTGKLDDGASTWVDPATPYWLLTALHVEPAPLAAGAAVAAVVERAAAAEKHLDAVRARLAAVLEVPGLDAFELARLGPGRSLLLLPVTATEPVNRVLGEIRGELGAAASLGLSGLPVSAAALCGPEAPFAGQAAQVVREARVAAEQRAGVAAKGDYAALFGDAAVTAEGVPADEPVAVGGAAAAPAVALLRPAATGEPGGNGTAFAELPVPAWQGLAVAEVAAGLAQAAEVAQRVAAAAVPPSAQGAAVAVHAVADGSTWIAAPLAGVPGFAERAVEAYLLWWGNRPPFALAAALTAGAAAASAEVAWQRAAVTSRPLPAHAAQVREKQPELSLPKRLHGASVAYFPRFAGDGRSIVPLEDLRVVLGLSTHVLGLAGTRRDDETGQVVRVGRGDGTVARLCSIAAREALPEPQPGAVATANGRNKNKAPQPADPRWRARLTYRLMKRIGMRRQYSRKRKALPNPVDQLVEVLRSNRWEALNRETVREAALYLDLAARWAHGVLGSAADDIVEGS